MNDNNFESNNNNIKSNSKDKPKNENSGNNENNNYNDQKTDTSPLTTTPTINTPITIPPTITSFTEDDKFNRETSLKQKRRSRFNTVTGNSLTKPLELAKETLILQPNEEPEILINLQKTGNENPKSQSENGKNFNEKNKNQNEELKSGTTPPKKIPKPSLPPIFDDKKSSSKNSGFGMSLSGEKMKLLLEKKNQNYNASIKNELPLEKPSNKQKTSQSFIVGVSKTPAYTKPSLTTQMNLTPEIDHKYQNNSTTFSGEGMKELMSQGESFYKNPVKNLVEKNTLKTKRKSDTQSIDLLHSSLEETRFQRDQFKNLLSQIHNELHTVISKKDEKLKNLRQEISTIKQKYQQTCEQLNRIKELPVNEEKDEEIRRDLFFSLALAIKLSLSMSGKASNKDLQVLYEHIETKRFTKISEWPTYILEFLSEPEEPVKNVNNNLRTPPRGVNNSNSRPSTPRSGNKPSTPRSNK
eukprot:TRINITY_DN5286_c0_g4_i1.p1 TRINITY_DN5286_c0_g4~~TRINITY_DN5286_c0_g4_i1.p1  ORF type:complete len:469 (-),score=165.35 TRINITY_DN5286_c0_g4_i1:52-1458(-)